MASYVAAHQYPEGPGDTRPTALQIIKDQNVEGGLQGKVIVITGCSSGIGIETARAMSATDATLILTARNSAKGQAALSDILEYGRVTLIQMDNTSFASVRNAASAILAQSKNQVNILINNAGVMAIPDLQLTEDGHEMQFVTNHLSHFLLFQLLKPALLASSTPSFNSRVVNVSSCGRRVQGLNESDNYNFQKGNYNPWLAYGQSKTANVYMASEIDRRYGSKGMHALSLHPGGIDTPLQKHMDKGIAAVALEKGMRTLKSPEQGASTTVFAAVAKEWEGRGGRYLTDCVEAPRDADDEINVEELTEGYVAHTYYEKEEKRLWKDSLKIVGVEDDYCGSDGFVFAEFRYGNGRACRRPRYRRIVF
jgi:NAD(P)-dependent dehydrogenase (short-subunit alcohol dehydrogenase family)